MADVYAGLDPVLVEKLEQLEILAGREGIPLQIKQGYRTPHEQARLYAQGRTTPGAIVTYARPGQSRHQSGRAVDVVPVQDGKPDDASPYWGRLGALGKSLGLVWGGDFTKLNDRYHFELPDAAEDQTRGRRVSPPGVAHLPAAFRAKVEQVATRLRMDPQHLLTVMSFETAGTFDPAVRNQAGSGATGLIQFLPTTARQLGTTTDALARMTPEQQLDYVERYLRPYAGRMRTQQDAYMAVLYPAAIGKPASQVLFPQGTRAYELNKALDKEEKGHVTVGDTVASLGRWLTRQVAPAQAEAAAPTEGTRMTPQQIDQRIRELEALEAQDARRRELDALETPAPAAPSPGGDVDVQVLGPPGTYQGPREEVSLTPAAPPAAAAPPPTLAQNAAAFWQDPWGYVKESLTGPIPAEYYAPTAAPPLLQQAGALAIPTMTTAIGAGVLGVPGALGGAYLGRRANVALGLEPEGTLGDVLSVAPLAVPAVVGGAKAVARGVTRWSRAGQAIQQADEAARAAQQTYQEGVQTAAQQTADQRATAVAQQQQREAVYQQRVQQQRTRAEAAHQTREAQRATQATERQAQAVQQAEDATAAQQQQYQQQVQQYEQAVGGQRQAVQTARGLPTAYGPETPSRTLYNRFRDLAPEAQVPLTTLQETAAGLQQQASRGFETVTPTRLQAVLDEVQRLPAVVDGLTVHRLMQDIGPLTRSPNSQIRGMAKQLYAGFQDALEKGAAQLPETAEARQVLLAANRAARREFAVDDVRHLVRRATSRTPEGQIRFNAARALDQLDRLYEENALFRGAWTPEEWQALTGQMGELTQAPRIPARPGAPPAPVQPREVEPFAPTPFAPPAPPARRAPYTAWKPDVPGPKPPAPVVPTLPAASDMARSVRELLRGGGIVNALLGGPGGVLTGTAAGVDVLGEVIQHLLMRQEGQRYLRALVNANGTVNREVLIKLAGGRAALAQMARQQEGTATPQEAEQAVGTLRQRYAP